MVQPVICIANIYEWISDEAINHKVHVLFVSYPLAHRTGMSGTSAILLWPLETWKQTKTQIFQLIPRSVQAGGLCRRVGPSSTPKSDKHAHKWIIFCDVVFVRVCVGSDATRWSGASRWATAAGTWTLSVAATGCRWWRSSASPSPSGIRCVTAPKYGRSYDTAVACAFHMAIHTKQATIEICCLCLQVLEMLRMAWSSSAAACAMSPSSLQAQIAVLGGAVQRSMGGEYHPLSAPSPAIGFAAGSPNSPSVPAFGVAATSANFAGFNRRPSPSVVSVGGVEGLDPGPGSAARSLSGPTGQPGGGSGARQAPPSQLSLAGLPNAAGTTQTPSAGSTTSYSPGRGSLY